MKQPKKLSKEECDKAASWKPLQAYEKGDLVWHNRSIWRCQQPCISREPSGGKEWEFAAHDKERPTTSKPCPACGRRTGRVADRVCGRCESKFVEVGILRKELEEKAPHDIVVTQASAGYRNVPYFTDHYCDHGKKPYHLADTLVKLARSVGVPTQNVERKEVVDLLVLEGKEKAMGGNWGDYFRIPKLFHTVLQKLLVEIVRFGEQRYRSGFSDGESLLRGLASGKTSIEKYNKLTIKGE